MNTKRNPDMIMPGGAIKGNQYFRYNPDEEKNGGTTLTDENQTAKKNGTAIFEAGDLSEEGDNDKDGDDMFDKLKK